MSLEEAVRVIRDPKQGPPMVTELARRIAAIVDGRVFNGTLYNIIFVSSKLVAHLFYADPSQLKAGQLGAIEAIL